MTAHRPETFTPVDGAVVVDCSCGAEYTAITPHGTLESMRPAEESAALQAAHDKHVKGAS